MAKLAYDIIAGKLNEPDGDVLEDTITEDFNHALANLSNEFLENTDKEIEPQLNIDSEELEVDINENITQELISSLAGVYAVSRIATNFIYENMCKEDDVVTEAQGTLKTVVRKGKLVQKLVCPEGMKAENGKCVLMSRGEKMKRIKASKKSVMTRKKNAGSNKVNAAKLRKLSDKVRKQKATIVSKTRPGG